MAKKKLIYIIVFIEIVLFLFYTIKAIRLKYSGDLQLTGDAIGIMEKDNDNFILPENYDYDSKVPVLRIYYGDLDPGTYLGTVDYKIENNKYNEKENENTNTIEKSEHELYFTCSELVYVKANNIILDSKQNKLSFYVTITNPVKKFAITVANKGYDNFQINIHLYKSYKGIVKSIFIIISVFTCLESAIIIFSKKPEFQKPAFLVLLISCFSFLPYMLTGINNGHDLPFHFMRIEALAKSFEDNVVPVYIQPLWIGNYGFPVSIYYGDILLYFPALLRLLGFPFNEAYKIFVFFINVLTTLTSYISYKSIFKNKKTAWITTFIYVCSPYRFVDIYVRSAVGEYCGMAFLPLVCAGFYGILNYSTNNKKTFSLKPDKFTLFLSSGMSGLILTHVLSSEMTVILLIIVSLIFIRKYFLINCFISLLKAALQCLVITAFFLVPFIDSYLSQETQLQYSMKHETPAIQEHGIQIGELFMFFKNVFGEGRSFFSGETNRMYLSIGPTLIVCLLLSFYFIFQKRGSKLLLFYSGMSCFTLFMASDIFPWNSFAYYSNIGKLMAQIQFPWRYLTFSTLFSVLATGEIISIASSENNSLFVLDNYIHKKKIILYLFLLMIFEFLVMSSNYASFKETVVLYNTNDLDTGAIAHTEYQPALTNSESFNHKEIKSNNVYINNIIRKGMKWSFYAETDEKDGQIIMPALYYKGYKASNEVGQQFELNNNINNQISFTLPPNFFGNIIVEFKPLWYWQTAQIISISYVLYLMAIMRKKIWSHL